MSSLFGKTVLILRKVALFAIDKFILILYNGSMKELTPEQLLEMIESKTIQGYRVEPDVSSAIITPMKMTTAEGINEDVETLLSAPRAWWELTEEEKRDALALAFRRDAGHITLDSGTILEVQTVTDNLSAWNSTPDWEPKPIVLQSGTEITRTGQYFHDGELHPLPSPQVIKLEEQQRMKETKMDKLYQVFVVNLKMRKMVEVIYVVTKGLAQAEVKAALESQHITKENVNDFHLLAEEMGAVPDAE